MGGRPNHYTESRAPWEQSTAPVPYLRSKSGSKDPTEAERQAITALWTTREHDQAGRRTGSRDVYVRDFQDDRGSMHLEEQENMRAKAPSTAPPWTSPRAAPSPPLPQAPYDSSNFSEAPRSAPALPPLAKGPHSPPLGSGKSFSSTDSRRGPAGISRASEPTVTAFPGTMSSRERSLSRRRIPRSASADAVMPAVNKEEGSSFGKRLKSAFKDMFKREPVDESNLERIEGRHWAEDEY